MQKTRKFKILATLAALATFLTTSMNSYGGEDFSKSISGYAFISGNNVVVKLAGNGALRDSCTISATLLDASHAVGKSVSCISTEKLQYTKELHDLPLDLRKTQTETVMAFVPKSTFLNSIGKSELNY